jgi:hypothetical protein
MEEAESTAMFSHFDLSEPDMKGQNNGIQMGGH